MRNLDAAIWNLLKRKTRWWGTPTKWLAQNFKATTRQVRASLARLLKAGKLPAIPEDRACSHDALTMLSDCGSRVLAVCKVCGSEVTMTRYRFNRAKACSATCAAKYRWQRAQ